MRDSFIFYRSYAEALRELTDKQRLHLLDAIIAYVLDNESITLNGVEKGMFALIRPQLDANNQRYENGCKGGAPKGNKNAQRNNRKTTEKQPMFEICCLPDNNQITTEIQPNENDNDNVNVKERVVYVNSNNAPAHARMNPPSVDEVREYCRDIGSAVDAQRFVDYYTANGWLVGKNPMRDWKAMVRRWGTFVFDEEHGDAPKDITHKKYSDEYLNSLSTIIAEDDE